MLKAAYDEQQSRPMVCAFVRRMRRNNSVVPCWKRKLVASAFGQMTASEHIKELKILRVKYGSWLAIICSNMRQLLWYNICYLFCFISLSFHFFSIYNSVLLFTKIVSTHIGLEPASYQNNRSLHRHINTTFNLSQQLHKQIQISTKIVVLNC